MVALREGIQERNRAKAALTDLFSDAKNGNAHVIVQRISNDIDDIVRKVRFPGWQQTAQGHRLCRRSGGRPLPISPRGIGGMGTFWLGNETPEVIYADARYRNGQVCLGSETPDECYADARYQHGYVWLGSETPDECYADARYVGGVGGAAAATLLLLLVAKGLAIW